MRAAQSRRRICWIVPARTLTSGFMSLIQGLLYQVNHIGWCRHGHEGIDARAPRVSRRQSVQQMPERHQREAKELTCNLYTVALAQGQPQHPKVRARVQGEYRLPKHMGCFQPPPLRIGFGSGKGLLL